MVRIRVHFQLGRREAGPGSFFKRLDSKRNIMNDLNYTRWCSRSPRLAESRNTADSEAELIQIEKS